MEDILNNCCRIIIALPIIAVLLPFALIGLLAMGIMGFLMAWSNTYCKVGYSGKKKEE
jgi:hypothetical protein